MNSIKRVAVIGLGYIGLPTAAILATNGLQVIGVDVNRGTVDAVNRGEVPFVEPDLGIHVAGAVSQGKLRATDQTPKADAYIVAVPTPFKGDRSADLSYIEAAARGIAPQLEGGELIILESTSPPRATRHLGEYILSLRPDLSLDGVDGKPAILLAHCPERVLPGRVMIELVTNDRIVGGVTPEAAELAKSLYTTFCQGEIHVTDDVTAEMAKLVENSYRDVNIAFANELSVISDGLGIDVWELITLANHHPRVNILQPGPGVGGHCIAVDPWFIVAEAPEHAKLIRTARMVNDAKPLWVVDKVLNALRAAPAGTEVAVLGLAFKANIDDLRESPAIEVTRLISQAAAGTQLNVVEPHVEELPRQLQFLENVKLTGLTDALSNSGVVLVLVDHDDFKAIDLTDLENKRLIDTRGILSV
ncbi:UDP-N-acetyl-D-mannosamine dehydrogenase [Arthrobacter sp. AL08]|uniref:UDP-N-acetyl-D-mannosamine dehydrogenase n=1 Tax=unclassified Arthrobacter TaxID=235627 RepID=UPI00249A0A5C|nr:MULTISPECIES: UDP-N-acetyl-D-mannosamine dehydrogenase [unclassified Arthrobacter]MDI3242485.1 UDP-N-acetyl-D-mannosamine dehydrogenase [Arthrobacter sp. AL05]MDI3278519.1 UDP-N-acetyl-D-mannosamine dehydrogenase [Arthrobacter sp. AL08]